MATLDHSKLKIEKKELFVPTLDEVKNIFLEALKENYMEAEVEVVDCPDLTEQPFTMAAPGLGGRLTILEVGGPAYLLPSVQREKVYDVQPLLKQLKYGDRAFVAGAGAGPWPLLTRNCEMMMNVFLDNSKFRNESYIASVCQVDESIELEAVMDKDTRFALLANLFACEGIPGKVLKVRAKVRKGNKDFISTMQQALAEHYKDQLVGLGGTFILNQGKAKQHIMRDFSKTPINSVKELDEWLKYYDMSAPLIAVGTFVSAETELDLRVQHFHSFSHHGDGGHYHIDTTPLDVEYIGYFNLGEVLYRVDQPPNRLLFGKD